jgi:SAM-dependent methyltransferase
VTTTAVHCPACGSGELTDMFHQPSVPQNSCLLLDSAEEARGFPRGELAVAWCGACGFLTNRRFVEGSAEYSQRYEETQLFSPTFVDFARDLAERWVKTHDLADRTVLEIGCGKGEFLTWMVEAGAGRGIGIDPGVHPERITSAAADRLRWIADFYGPAYSHLDADAVVCRHTLEHIPDVARFLGDIRTAIGDRPDTVVLFELPDVQRILDECAFWDVYYEHCSYFSAGSLARLFRRCGFEVLSVEREYADQYLVLEARPAPGPVSGAVPLPLEDDMRALAAGTEHYRRSYAELRASWRGRLAAVRQRGGTSVVWGGGSKGVAFISYLGLGDEVDRVVDINPYKQGRFLPGSGHPVVAPEALLSAPPELVVVMNPVYLGEIAGWLADNGLRSDVVAV